MTEAFVTGGDGFIGRHLMARLKDRSTVTVHHADITRTLWWLKPYRHFFFLSAYGNMAHHTDNEEILNANVAALGSVLHRTLADNILPDCFLFVSSSSVNLPTQTAYSRTKRAGEEIVLAMLPAHGCVVRPYSVTGPCEQPEHLIPTLIRSCMEGTPMELVPHATHDYVDVRDVAAGLVALADQNANGIFEFGSGIPTTNEEVRLIVEAACGQKANVRIVEKMRAYDDTGWHCRKPAQEFKRTKSLVDSIRDMAEVYKSP